MERDEPWLSAEEARLWRAWIDATRRIERRIAEQLRRDADMSHDEYAVLAMLSGASGTALRMSAIADNARIPRTRLTHQVDRLERLGVVRRSPAADDGRAIVVELTDTGAALMPDVALGHVRTVRAALLDALEPDQVAALAALLEIVGDHLKSTETG